MGTAWRYSEPPPPDQVGIFQLSRIPNQDSDAVKVSSAPLTVPPATGNVPG